MAKAPSYRYSVDANGAIHAADGVSWTPTGRILVDGVQTSTLLGPFTPSERDLLRVSSAILDVDRLSPRKVQSAERALQRLVWQREISVEVAVEDPERWNTVATDLTRLLTFMTDDTWDLRFVGASAPRVQEIMKVMQVREADEIALFSGGLDSVVGMYARSRERQGRFLAVSACGNDVRGRAQSIALEALRQEGVVVDSLKFVHQLRGTHRSRSRMESSQRVRGLLFLAMGAATASHLGKSGFVAYETGIGCVNMSMSRAQVGAQGTRALHPRTVIGFNSMLTRVLDAPVRASLPFFLRTKGELCRAAGDRIQALAKVTNSCDEGDGHKADSTQHCGVCTSCLFRRIALRVATPNDPSQYRDRVMRKHGEYELRLFEHHGRDLARCTGFADLVQLDPSVRFARDLPVLETPERARAEAQVLAMYRRYAVEIEAFLTNARPALTHVKSQRRKEAERDLFAAVG